MDVSAQKNQLYTLDKTGDGQDPSLKPLSTYISEAYNDYKRNSFQRDNQSGKQATGSINSMAHHAKFHKF